MVDYNPFYVGFGKKENSASDLEFVGHKVQIYSMAPTVWESLASRIQPDNPSEVQSEVNPVLMVPKLDLSEFDKRELELLLDIDLGHEWFTKKLEDYTAAQKYLEIKQNDQNSLSYVFRLRPDILDGDASKIIFGQITEYSIYKNPEKLSLDTRLLTPEMVRPAFESVDGKPQHFKKWVMRTN